MRGYLRKKIVVLMLVVMVIMPFVSLPVEATPATRNRLQEVERNLGDARQNVRDQQNLLAGTRYEMSALMDEIQTLDQRIMDTAAALVEIEYALYESEIRVEEALAAWEAAKLERDIQQDVFRARFRSMHEQGQVGLLEILFEAQSITEFFMLWEYVQLVAQFDQETLTQLEHAEAEELRLLDRLSADRLLVADLRRQQEFALQNVKNALEERQIWFELLAEDEEQMAELLAMFEEEQRLLEQDFTSLQALLQQEMSAEAARIAAEQRNAQLARLNNFDGQFMWPIPTHSPGNRRFGMHMHPILREYRMHNGVDVGAPTGTRLYAAADGYVRLAGWSGGFGNTVIIDHGNGYSTLYAHNSRNRVVAGQRVYQGQHIADVGSTGLSTGPHLHFEIRVNNRPVDPMRYFQ